MNVKSVYWRNVKEKQKIGASCLNMNSSWNKFDSGYNQGSWQMSKNHEKPTACIY